jgi:hypothetical protein
MSQMMTPVAMDASRGLMAAPWSAGFAGGEAGAGGDDGAAATGGSGRRAVAAGDRVRGLGKEWEWEWEREMGLDEMEAVVDRRRWDMEGRWGRRRTPRW